MRHLLIVLGIVLVLGGCSPFRKQQRLDLTPFAESTITLAADIEYGLTAGAKGRSLREYRSDPRVIAHKAYWEEIRQLVRGVVAYSVEATTLGNSKLPETERCELFATFLDRLTRPVLTKENKDIRFTLDDLDNMTARIREQKTFFAALGEAQPLIDEVGRLADIMFDIVEDDMESLTAYLAERIDEANAGPVGLSKMLLVAQQRVFESIIMVREYRLTRDPAVLERMYANELELPNLLKNPNEPTPKDLLTIEERMIYKLGIGNQWKELLAHDMNAYREQQDELDQLYVAAVTQLRKARITIAVWTRAHRNLSQGVTDPARINIFNITQKAVKTVL